MPDQQQKKAIAAIEAWMQSQDSMFLVRCAKSEVREVFMHVTQRDGVGTDPEQVLLGHAQAMVEMGAGIFDLVFLERLGIPFERMCLLQATAYMVVAKISFSKMMHAPVLAIDVMRGYRVCSCAYDCFAAARKGYEKAFASDDYALDTQGRWAELVAWSAYWQAEVQDWQQKIFTLQDNSRVLSRRDLLLIVQNYASKALALGVDAKDLPMLGWDNMEVPGEESLLGKRSQGW